MRNEKGSLEKDKMEEVNRNGGNEMKERERKIKKNQGRSGGHRKRIRKKGERQERDARGQGSKSRGTFSGPLLV